MKEKPKPDCIIRPATAEDVISIISISEEHELRTKSPERIAAEGFLVSAYSSDKYLRWLKHLTIAQIGNSVAGFTLTFRRAEVPPDLTDADKVFAAAGTSDFLLIKQVGVSRHCQKMGVGRALYSFLFRTCCCPCFAPIIHAPRNDVSIAYHTALGFCCAVNYNGADGKERGIYRRDPVAC